MNLNFKRYATALSALLAVSVSASAQEISTSLPLTSVGDQLMWTVGDQELSLDVPLTGRVRLELYSPRLDQADYRSDTYYGDEQYDANASQVATTFTVIRDDGTAVLTRVFTPGPHAWETLLDQELPAGRYKVKAVTAGNGKNTFAIRVAGVSATITADLLTVNLHSREWVPALKVSTDGQASYVLRFYDGDAPLELEARLRDQDGKIYPLVVSGNLAYADAPLPRQAQQYTVELRQPATAKQYSNTVGFRLTRAGAPEPIAIAKVDQTGVLRVKAELVLPDGNHPTTANITVGTTPLQVQGQLAQPVKADTYAVTAAPVTGAQVTVTPGVTVPKNGQGQVSVQIRPQVALTLHSDKPEVCLGDTFTLTARAETAFAGELPFELNVEAGSLTLAGVNNLQSTLSAARPGELVVTGTATQAGPLTVRARLAGWNQEQTLGLNVRPDATSLQLGREALPAAQVGDEITVRLTLKNTADQAVPFILTDTPGSGLEALDPTEFSGELQAGQTKTLSYRARVVQPGTATLKAELLAEGCAAVQTAAGQVTAQAESTPEPTPETPTAPQVSRLSTITLPFDAPRQARELVIAHALPAGADFVPGSSKLDGQPIADPKRGSSGTLYWVLAEPGSSPGTASGAAIRGQITYDLTHPAALDALPKPALLARYKGERSEVLEGQINQADLQAATDLTAPEQVSENPGGIKLPLAGSDILVRDRISVVVESPLDAPTPTLSMNGQIISDDRIGETTEDGPRGVRRLTYVGVPLQVGENTIAYGQEHITVYRVGPTARIEVKPETLIADGSTPLRLNLRTLDASGRASEPGSVTVRSNLEVRVPDADPGLAGYQVKIVNGQGVLELQPQSSPTTLKLDVLQGEQVKTYTFDVKPDASRVGVGVLSATVGLGSGLSLSNVNWQGRASLETPLAGGKLYVAADKDGLPTDRDTLKRFTIHGDSSVESVPLQGIDPVALTYDHPSFRVDYRQSSLPMDVLPVGENLTALTAYSKSNPQVSAFVAAVPGDRVSGEKLTPDGTRILRLKLGNISAGSETLDLVTYERLPGTQTLTGKELRRVTLVRNVDYQLDLQTGVITLNYALDHLDAALNELVVEASYRVDDPLGNRQLAYGVQLAHTGQHYRVGVAAISLDNTVTYGARASYDNGTLRADGLLAYSGGFQASADFSAKVRGQDLVQAQVRYQDANYHGLAPLNPGLNATASYSAHLNPNLSAGVQGEYHSSFSSTPTQGGSVTARADYRLNPFSVGAGVKYAFGDQNGLGAVLGVGYHQKPLDVDITHTQPLTGNLDTTTTVTTRYALNDKVTLGLTDNINWKTGQTAALTLDTRLGNTNYQVAYDLPNSSGQGNRARFGVTSSLPLNDHLTAGLHGSALYDLGKQSQEIGAGLDLNYKTDRLVATAGTDLVYRHNPDPAAVNNGFGVVLRGGLSGSLSDDLTLSADGLVEFGAGKNGQRFAVGYAYRGRNFNSLGTVRYVNGTLAGNQPEWSSNLAAEYRQPSWAVRGNLDTRTLLLDPGSFTAQLGVSGMYYPTDFLGIGAWGRAITQPATQTTSYGLGLEASVRALPGTWVTLGYNPVGFSGIGSQYTQQGAYLRLDLTLDESLLGGQK